MPGRGLRKRTLAQVPGGNKFTDAVSQTALTYPPADAWRNSTEKLSYSMFPESGYLPDSEYNLDDKYGILRVSGKALVHSVSTQTVFDKIPAKYLRKRFPINLKNIGCHRRHMEILSESEDTDCEWSDDDEIFQSPIDELLFRFSRRKEIKSSNRKSNTAHVQPQNYVNLDDRHENKTPSIPDISANLMMCDCVDTVINWRSAKILRGRIVRCRFCDHIINLDLYVESMLKLNTDTDLKDTRITS